MKLIAPALFVSFLNLFFFHRLGSTAIVLLTIGLFIFIKNAIRGYRFFGKDIKFLAVLSLISLFILYRSFPLVIFLFISLVIFSFINYSYQSLYNIPFFHDWIDVFISPIRLAKIYFESVTKKIFLSGNDRIIKKSNFGRKTKVLRVILGGLVISAPVLFILIVLFSAADPVYGKFIRELLNFKLNIDPWLWQRIIISAVLFIIFLPFTFLRKRAYTAVKMLNFQKYTFSSEMGVAILLIAITLGSFLLIQYPYVFVNVPKEINLSTYGIQTYSEYVRRGFVELIAAAVIIYSSIFAGLLVWRNSKEDKRGFLRQAQLFLLFEFFIFIISLFRRIGLYQTYHGWSLVRIYGCVFLLFLSFITLTLTLRHIIARKWVYIEILAVYLLIFALGIFNAEHFIATTDHPPTVNNQIDYVYLSRLSSDGVEGWIKSYNYAKEVLNDNNLKEKNIIKIDERRKIAYAGIISGNLFSYYHSLIFRYGSSTEVEDYLSTLFKNEKRYISQKSYDKTVLYFRIPPYQYSFDTINYDYFYGFRENETGGNLKQLNFLDKLYIWNYSEKQAFERMKKEIGIQNLLVLQKEYLDLYRKIQKQPSGENGYEFDISLNSPLID